MKQTESSTDINGKLLYHFIALKPPQLLSQPGAGRYLGSLQEISSLLQSWGKPRESVSVRDGTPG